jgi:hypothetical protein
VEAANPGRPDEDLLSVPGLSFQAERAKVLSVAKAAVEFNREKHIGALERVKRARYCKSE